MLGLCPGLSFADALSVGVDIQGDDVTISLEKKGGFADFIGNQMMTTEGSLGDRNRAMLHAILDAWIDGVESPV
jgi:hypothetical protein